MKHAIYMNLYRSGLYHKQGKPDTTNMHGGDVYSTEQLALENAEPDRGYITTIRAEMELPDGMELYVNPTNSVPTPLSVTHRDGTMALLPYMQRSKVLAINDVGASIETNEAAATELSYAAWRRQYGVPATGYKPAHGGYPSAYDAKAHAEAYPGY